MASVKAILSGTRQIFWSQNGSIHSSGPLGRCSIEAKGRITPSPAKKYMRREKAQQILQQIFAAE